MFKSCGIVQRFKQLQLIIYNFQNKATQKRHSSCPIFCGDSKQFEISRKLINLQKLSSFSIHTASKLSSKEQDFKHWLTFDNFHKMEIKNKASFMEAIKLYDDNFKNRKGVVDFIETALVKMKEFNVHDELECYKALIDLMPKGTYVARSRLQIAMFRYPKHQSCAMALMDQMTHFGVNPDVELGAIVKKIFGPISYPLTAYGTLMYWSTKFKNKSPWELPKKVPVDTLLLGKMAIERITSVDIQTKITVFQTNDVPESIDKTWIVSGQSPKQRMLLKDHPPTVPVIVESGENIWLRNKLINYFTLKADGEPLPYKPPRNADDLMQTDTMFFNPNYTDEDEPYSVHQQDDGIIYGVCTTGTSSKDSLLSWVRLLQDNGNPILGDVPVLFRFKDIEKVPAMVTENDASKINNSGQ